MAPHFKEIVCVFMYFVKGLDHIDNYLRAVKARYANVTILQVPIDVDACFALWAILHS